MFGYFQHRTDMRLYKYIDTFQLLTSLGSAFSGARRRATLAIGFSTFLACERNRTDWACGFLTPITFSRGANGTINRKGTSFGIADDTTVLAYDSPACGIITPHKISLA